MGHADPEVIDSVVAHVAGQTLVSVALGEIANPSNLFIKGVDFAKWGLAGCGRLTNWSRKLRQTGRRLQARCPRCRPVVVAYADWQAAAAPRPREIMSFVGDEGWGAVLVDTWQKSRTLVQIVSAPTIFAFCERCRERGLKVALAGSLGASEIRQLAGCGADWFAVRGAVCRHGTREAVIVARQVRMLARLVECLRPVAIP
jgi:uncharacterized protein (UPF0264 family)